jgi:3-oxoacyl-[acyl-carrier protein] reductase
MNFGLTGKRVLVTGSWRGTGNAIACAFAREGADVLVHGFEEGQADTAVCAMLDAKLVATPVTGDLLTDAGAKSFAARILAGGVVDVLVNNYGTAAGARWDDDGTGDWIEMYERNVLSGVRIAKLLVPAMRRRGQGRVIFLGTVGAVRPRAVMPGYYAAKAALPAVVVSLAKELAGSGITVNCVSPGVVRTAEVEQHFRARAERKGWGDDWNEIERRAIDETIGAGSAATRFGRLEEIAATVVFLASEQAAYINGVDLRVDGGAADCVR